MSKVTSLGIRTVAYFPSLRSVCQKLTTSSERSLVAYGTRSQSTSKATWLASDFQGFSKEFPLPGAVSLPKTQWLKEAEFTNVDHSVEDFPCTGPAKVEMNVLKCPEHLHNGFIELFSSVCIEKGKLTVLTLSQCTENDMTCWSSSVEEERDELTKHFVESSVEICSRLQANGYWADFIDPSSGRAFFSPHSNNVLMETDDRFSHLGFEILDLGCCKAISHPNWGSKMPILYGELYRDFPHRLCTHIILQMRKTLLAGRSVASPKALKKQFDTR